MSTGGTPDPYKPVDPNGLQTASTASTALGFAALVGSGAGDTVASLMGWGTASTKVVAAGLSMLSVGRLSLFAVGLMLVGLGIALNIASLVVRQQLSQEYDARLATYEEERKKEQAQRERGPGGGA